jgi:quinol monooxygenase YgiN
MLAASVLILCLCPSALAQAAFVRLADIEVDPRHLESFKAAAREHGEATMRVEPGALALHAVAEKENASRIRVFEMYTDANAYRAHLQTPHFKQFRTTTDNSVRARELFETVPVVLGAKPQLRRSALVRIAELEIHPAQVDAYKAAVTEEIEASIRLEPGVLAIYSVTLKEQPTHFRFFEIYADEKAYRQHLESPHFRRYVELTKSMITARKLVETEPIALAVKRR